MYLHVQYIRVICRCLVSDACYNTRCMFVCIVSYRSSRYAVCVCVQKNRFFAQNETWREIMQRHTSQTLTQAFILSSAHTHTHIVCTHTNPIRWKGIRVKRSRRMIAFKGHIYIIRTLLFMYDAIKASKQAKVESRTQSSRFSYVYKYYSLTHSLAHARTQANSQIHTPCSPQTHRHTHSMPNILYHKKIVRYAQNVQISKAKIAMEQNEARDTLQPILCHVLKQKKNITKTILICSISH